MTAPDRPQPSQPEDVVVQVGLGRGRVFVSERMSLAEAQTVLTELRTAIRNVADSHLLVPFTAAGYPELHVRASRITDVGIRTVTAHRGHTGPRAAARAGRSGIVWTPRVLNRDDIAARVIG